jgi:hypothetical protein
LSENVFDVSIQFPIGDHTSAESNAPDDQAQQRDQCTLVIRIGKLDQGHQGRSSSPVALKKETSWGMAVILIAAGNHAPITRQWQWHQE